MKLGFHPEARAEVHDATDYFLEQDEALAAAFLDELDSVLDRVQSRPLMFPAYLEGTRRALIQRFHYQIVFRIEGENVEVLAVSHQRREPGYWQHRL